MAINTSISTIVTENLSYANGTTIVGQQDIPQMTASEMQLAVENISRNAIIPKLNSVITALNETYSKVETDKKIQDSMAQAGVADMSKGVYDPYGEVEAAGGIDSFVESKQAAHNSYVGYVPVTLTASSWGDTAPYAQTVAVSGINDTWVPGIPTVIVADTNDATQQRIEALHCISQINSGLNQLTFICFDSKPTVDLQIRVPGMVER